MKESHQHCMKAALKEFKKPGKRSFSIPAGDSFTALIDGQPFTATDVRGFHSFGVRIVVGLIDEGGERRYITVAADDYLAAGEYDVTLEGEVTIGYVVENAGGNNEYSAEAGRITMSSAENIEFSGQFNATLVESSPYQEITEACFKVGQTVELS
ncbi:hypothetical protein [Pseudomonas sp. 2835]|uniref:hypothetical protein n=1 Tax=Pseudomonas sp. 2835 TaxID=3156451 RepID=UPI003D25B809